METRKALKKGNTKVHAKIFDLPAIETCPNCRQCAKTCYAMKAQRMYKQTRAFRQANLELSKTDAFVDAILAEVKPGDVVRLHSSGDFYSQAYVDKWADIARKAPSVKFYVYTKTADIWDFSALKALANFNVIDSILPDGSINYGKPEVVEEKARRFNLPVCPDTKGQAGVECMKNCFLCLQAERMLFVIH